MAERGEYQKRIEQASSLSELKETIREMGEVPGSGGKRYAADDMVSGIEYVEQQAEKASEQGSRKEERETGGAHYRPGDTIRKRRSVNVGEDELTYVTRNLHLRDKVSELVQKEYENVDVEGDSIFATWRSPKKFPGKQD